MFEKITVKKKNIPSSTETAALVALKISVLLKGGMSLSRAVEHLSEQSGRLSDTSKRVKSRTDKSVSVPHAFAQEDEPCWRAFAVSLEVARRSGAPIAHSCERLSQAFLKIDSLQKKREVLLAGPKSTVVLITLLPFLSILISTFLGVDIFEELSSSRGITLLILGVALLILGVLWALVMIRNTARSDSVKGIELDLLWVALAGGQSPQSAIRLVADCADALRAEWVPLNSFTKRSSLHQILQTAKESGSPIRPLLSSEADIQRENSQTFLEKKAESLAIKILLPLGFCILPSFVFLGVLPLVMALMN